MKPALLYLRKYIQENYQNQKPNYREDKENNEKPIKKCSQEVIFKQKKPHQCEKTKVKQFYFKPSKNFSSLRFKHKLIPQPLKNQSNFKDLRIEPPSKQTSRHQIQAESKRHRRTIVSNGGEIPQVQNETQVDQITNQNVSEPKEVRFFISPPVQKTSKFGITPGVQQSFEQIPKKSQYKAEAIEKQQVFMDQLDCIINSQIQLQQTPEFIKSEHFKISSKSMKKLGYNTLYDYLNEMKKYQNIKKKQVKQACYYPLACMTPQMDENQQYEMVTKKQKGLFQQKQQKFKKEISVNDGFSSKTVQMKNFNSLKIHRKPKSNFSRSQSLGTHKHVKDQGIDNKSKKFLLEYEQIVICNCANKKYFSYKLSANTDYNSFFKYTTPFLECQPIKDNNYLIGNRDNQSLGLYFCCLINASLGVRQGLFWIGKPIQYYRKDKVIKVIDDFLFDVGAFGIFESDRLWIVDYHGRNSHIMKSLLTKCIQQHKSQQTSIKSTIKQKARISKRISLSMSQQPHTQTPEMFLSLLANFSQFTETMFVKKQRNNISTRGPFKLIYEPSENHYEKKKIDHQSSL